MSRRSIGKMKKAGFTTLEILLAVAVLVVLMGVGAAGLPALKRSISQKELNSKAEVIYIAAQNRLTQLKAAGLAATYEDGTIPTVNDSLRYVAKDGANTAQATAFLPDGYMDAELWNHCWVIEYDPSSATVDTVFYSEEESIGYTPAGRDALIAGADKKTGKVGYFTGAGGDTAEALETGTLHPYLDVVNAEELTATVTCPAPEQEDVKVQFNICVSNADGSGKTKAETVTPSLDGSGNYVYSFTLDTLKGEESDRFANKYLGYCTPGANIVISVEAIPIGDGKAAVDSYTVSSLTNSLFASFTEGTAQVCYGRHLQNLDAAEVEVTDVLQIGDIDWAAAYPDRNFVPLTNEDIETYKGLVAEDKTPVIYNLTVSTAGTDGGLFETFSGTAVEHLRLCDTRVIASGASAGALMGSFAGDEELTLTDVTCYLDADDLAGSGTHKVLADFYTDGTAEKGLSATAMAGLDGTTVGGLIGKIPEGKTVSISGCSVSTVAGSAGTASAGGLVGENLGTLNISKSYADCYLTAANVGGLVGKGNAASVTNSYAAGFAEASSTAAGLVNGDCTTLENDYTVLHFSEDAKTWSAAKSCTNTPVNLFAMAEGSEKGAAVEKISEEDADDVLTKLGTDNFKAVGDDFLLYDLTEDLPDYIFPVLKDLPQYGDWDVTDDSDEYLVYYEVYSDGSYGFWAKDKNNTLKDNRTIVGDGYGLLFEKEQDTVTVGGTELTKLDKEIRIDNKDRYFYPIPANQLNTVGGNLYQELQVTVKPTIGSETTRSYFLNPLFAKGETQCESQQELDTLLGSEGLEVVIRTPRHLYSLSQKSGTNSWRNGGKETTFTQELDLNYATYQWTTYANVSAAVTAQAPIGNSSGFSDIYDGNYHKITGLTGFVSAGKSYGLFGTNTGTVKNVTLMGNDTSVSTDSKLSYAGLFMSENSGTVENCVLSGYSFTDSNKATVGGFVGKNSGTIKNCVCNLSTLVGNGTAGGFAGENSGTIQNCESNITSLKGTGTVAGFVGENAKGGKITESYSLAVFPSSDGTRSGFAGDNTAGTITGCYSFALGYVSDNFPLIGFTEAGTVTDCYFVADCSVEYNSEKGTCVFTKNDDGSYKGTGTAVTLTDLADQKAKDPLFKKYSSFGFITDEKYTLEYAETLKTKAPYPYPATVTDKDGNRIHYGNWPEEITYLSWDDSGKTVEVNLLEHLTKDGTTLKVDPLEIKLYCSGDTMTAENFTYDPEPPTVVEKLAEDGIGELTGSNYGGGTNLETYRTVTVNLVKAGSDETTPDTKITASIGEKGTDLYKTDTLSLNITASFKASADKTEIKELKVKKSEEISLTALVGEKDISEYVTKWNFTYSNSTPLATIEKDDDGNYKVVAGKKKGTEVITVTAEVLVNGVTYTSDPVTVTVTVKPYTVTYNNTNIYSYTGELEAEPEVVYSGSITMKGAEFVGMYFQVNGVTLTDGYEINGDKTNFTFTIDADKVTGDIDIYVVGNSDGVSVTLSNQALGINYGTSTGARLYGRVASLFDNAYTRAVPGVDYVCYIDLYKPTFGRIYHQFYEYTKMKVTVNGIVLDSNKYTYEKVQDGNGYRRWKLIIPGEYITGPITIEPVK